MLCYATIFYTILWTMISYVWRYNAYYTFLHEKEFLQHRHQPLHHGQWLPKANKMIFCLGHLASIKAYKILGQLHLPSRSGQYPICPAWLDLSSARAMLSRYDKDASVAVWKPCWQGNGMALSLLFYLKQYQTAGTHTRCVSHCFRQNGRGRAALLLLSNGGAESIALSVLMPQC